jgi:hypothetical protein
LDRLYMVYKLIKGKHKEVHCLVYKQAWYMELVDEFGWNPD